MFILDQMEFMAFLGFVGQVLNARANYGQWRSMSPEGPRRGDYLDKIYTNFHCFGCFCYNLLMFDNQCTCEW